MQISYSDLSLRGVTPIFPTIENFVFGLIVSLCLTAGATGQGFVTRLSTGRDGIRAALSFGVAQFQQFGEWRLTTGTGLHQGRGARARLARAAMALLLAPVGLTAQHPEHRKRNQVVNGNWQIKETRDRVS